VALEIQLAGQTTRSKLVPLQLVTQERQIGTSRSIRATVSDFKIDPLLVLSDRHQAEIPIRVDDLASALKTSAGKLIWPIRDRQPSTALN
jgi:hypothetical protein